MPNDVIEAVNALLRRDDPAGDMRLVDNYVDHYQRDPKKFVLPREHAYLRHLIGAYVNKPKAFEDLVQWMRDTIQAAEGSSRRYEDMQEFYRVLVVRHTQATRRERLARVRAKIHELHPELTAEQRDQWVRQCEQAWINERRTILDAKRHMMGGPVPKEEQRRLLDSFWEDVDRRIEHGVLPAYRPGAL